MSVSLKSILAGTQELKPLPVTAVNLAKALSDPSAGIIDFVEIIKLDQAITANVLRLANSVANVSLRTVTDIKSAVVRLGGARILGDILARHFSQEMAAPLPLYGYNENDLWRHSAASASAVSVMNAVLGISVPSAAFTAALLHDIGKLLISRTVDDTMVTAIGRELEEGKTSVEAEKKVLGFSHSDVGAALCAHWNLPQELTTAIRDHHMTNTNDLLTDIVRLANYTARTIGEGLGAEGLSISLGEDFFVRMKITKSSDFQRLCIETGNELARTCELFGISK